MRHNALLRRVLAGAVSAVVMAWLLPASAAWFDDAEKRLVPEADAFIQNKPEPLKRFFHTL
jgi:hypothetical protein